MTLKDFKKIQTQINTLIKQLEEAAVKGGQSIFSDQFNKLKDKLIKAVLKKNGISFKEYTNFLEDTKYGQEIADSEAFYFPGLAKQNREKVEEKVMEARNEFSQKANNLEIGIKQVEKTSFAELEKLNKKLLRKIEDVKKETNKKIPEIIKKNNLKHINILRDLNDFGKEQDAIYKDVESLKRTSEKISETIKDKEKQFNTQLDKNRKEYIKIMEKIPLEDVVQKQFKQLLPGPLRRLGMGLQAQIDAISKTGAGDVVGPATATDNAIARFNLATGKLIQNSLVTIDNSGTINIPTGQTYGINGTAITFTDVKAMAVGDDTYTIAPTAGQADYTSIQAALTAQTSGGELFLVYPGTYVDDTINFSADNQTIKGMGLTPDAIITNTAQIIDYGAWTGCRMNNIRIEGTYTTAIDMITGSGELIARDVGLVLEASGTIAGSPTVVSTTGKFKQVRGTMQYNNAAISTGQIKQAITIGAAATIELRRVNIDIDGSNASAAITLGYGSGTGVLDSYRCNVDVADTDATIVNGLAYLGGSGDHEYIGNVMHVTAGAAGKTGYGFLMTSSTSLTVRGMYNHLEVEDGGGTSYGFSVGANCTLISQFDDIIADDGNQITGTYTQVNSESDGALTLSGLLTANGGATFADNITIADTKTIQTGTTNDDYFFIKAKDTDVGLVEVGRVVGDVDPYFALGGSQEYRFYNSGAAQYNAYLRMNTDKQLRFRDSAIYINSIDDGHLDLTADISIDINGTLSLGTNNITGVGTINKVTITEPATSATLTIADGKAIEANFSATFNGGDTTLVGSGTNNYSYPASSDTLVGRTSTDILTNKTISTVAGTATQAPLAFAVGIALTTPVAGTVYFDGTDLLLAV